MLTWQLAIINLDNGYAMSQIYMNVMSAHLYFLQYFRDFLGFRDHKIHYRDQSDLTEYMLEVYANFEGCVNFNNVGVVTCLEYSPTPLNQPTNN